MSDDELLVMSEPIHVDDLMASTAAFLYRISTQNITGNPAQDMTDEDAKYLLYLAERLLSYNGILPDDWEFRMAPPGEE